jgi:hypothetical protein
MSVTPSPIGGFAAQFFDNNGVILSGGKIYTYAAGTTTPQATYTSASGVTPHANPIILDSAGRVPGGEIWLTDGLVYKFVIETATGILLGTYDNITGVNSNFVNYTVQEEVITATAGQTVFNLTTTNYTPGTNSLTVYIDGVNQYVGDSYLETDSDTVTFTAGLHVGAEVKFTTAIQTTTGAVDASIVSFTGFNGQTGSVQDLADDDGSDWIGFDQAGTGAVARSAQDKMRETVSVMDFGAVGDNVANDTAAIQAAIDYAAPLGKMVFIPSGTYKITKLTLPQQAGGIEIVGEARCDANSLSSGNYVGTVLISADTTGDIISADGGVSYENRNVKISNLSLRCATSGYAIYLKNCLEQTQLTNLTIFNSNTSGNGIGLESCWVGCLVSNCIITGSATSATGYGIKIFNDQLAGGYLIENTTAANFGTGMYFGDLVYQCIALNSAAEGCYFGFTVDDSANVQIDNCHTEFSKINGIYLISSAATQITSCSFVNDGTDTVVGFAKAAIYVVGSVSNVNQNLSIKSCYFINIPSDAAAVQIENSQYAQGVIDGNVMNALAGSTNNTGIIIAGPNIENWAVINNSGDIAVKYSPTVGFKIFTPSVGGLTNITFNATPVNPAFAPNNCLFVDAGTTKLSYKDSSGVTNALY